MKSHRIKIDRQTFERLLSRAQTGIVHRDGPSWRVGDTLWLSTEGDRAMMRTVTHVIDNAPGLVEGWAAVSLY